MQLTETPYGLPLALALLDNDDSLRILLLLLLLKLQTEGYLGTEAFALELVRFRSPGRIAVIARCQLSRPHQPVPGHVYGRI